MQTAYDYVGVQYKCCAGVNPKVNAVEHDIHMITTCVHCVYLS